MTTPTPPKTPMDDAPVIECTPGTLWTAVHTKPRCEKVVVDHCARHEIPCYLPLRCRKKRYQRRWVETFLPMFPGYVFVQTNPDRHTTLLQTHRVVHILQVDAVMERQLVEELRALQQLERCQAEQEIEVRPELVPGALVRICEGPLKGAEGIVERRNDGFRITVNIELLGQSASVLIESELLETEE